jgi:hypothetical protein
MESQMCTQRNTGRQALRLGLLVTLVVLALSACGGEKQQVSKARPLPEERQALHPGEYRTEVFKPSLSFKVSEGWTTSPPAASDALLLAWGETAVLVVANVHEVYKPTRTGTPNVVEAPKDMVGWFQEHPYLQTSKPAPATVGGVKGVQFDVVTETLPEDYFGACGSDCVDIFRPSSGGSKDLREGDKAHVIVLEHIKGETVTIGFASRPTEFEEFAPEAQKVMDSIKWTGS